MSADRLLELARTHGVEVDVPWVDNLGQPYVARINLAEMLADEVRALRAQLRTDCIPYQIQKNLEYRSTIERVEALLERWDAEDAQCVVGCVHPDKAAVRAALRGEP